MDSTVLNQSKLPESKSAVLISSTIFKLVEVIENKIKKGQPGKDLEELKYLKELCGSEDPLVNVTACHGFVYLVKSSVCLLSDTISTLVASIFSVKSVTGVISALTDLLVLELKSKLATESSYTSPYNSKLPQHPLVSVLKRRPEAWSDVLNQVSTICTHPDKQVQSHSLLLVKPVLVHVLVESNDLPESAVLQAFRITINYFSSEEFIVEGLASCLCWADSRVLEAVQMVTMMGQAAVTNKHGLHVSLCCLALAALVPRLLQAALCPQPCLHVLAQLAAAATNTHSTLLVLLADCIPTCPAIYLEHLLIFFADLLKRGQCSLDCMWMCVSALMPWLASNPSQLPKALHIATSIVSHASSTSVSASTTANLINNSAVAVVISADPRLTQAIHIANLSDELSGDCNMTLQWLNNKRGLELNQVYLYWSSLLISHSDPQVRLVSLKGLVESKAPMASSHILTLLVYQLAREKTPELQLDILRSLPSTTSDKSNVMGVVSTLEAVRRSNHMYLALLAVHLYCHLWMSQERCYSQLMDILNQNDYDSFQEPWLMYLLQANICKTICTSKPDMHGKEVVAKVSDILNRCGSVKESAASAVALEALIPLCQHDVVDVYTIWKSLAPRFSRDKRPLVLKSLCELVSVAAVQKSVSSDTDDALAQILKWLWTLIASSKHGLVVECALRAVSKFRLDCFNLKMLPECFRKGLKLPPEMAKTPVDAARKPEDVLDYIPGECWIQVIQHVNSESVSLAISNWIKMEISTFRGGGLYQVDRVEPSSYSHLPHHSVIRGVTTSLQQLCQSDAENDVKIANLCLVALAQTSSKPLPSLCWTFLNNLKDPKVANNIVRLAAKQSQISPSARKITENYLAAIRSDKENILFAYSILGDLCRGIPPNTLRPFLEATLQSSLNNKDYKQFLILLNCIKTTLKEEKIHDANKTLLHQQIRALWDLMEPQSEVLSEYFAAVSELPVSIVESMTSTSLMWEVTLAQLQKAFRLRAYMALIPDATLPLNWLNEIIEVASSNISEQTLALQLVTEVISQLDKHPTAWPWLQELMGQTHLLSTKNQSGVDFLVKVFVLCVDIMSGYYSLAQNASQTRALRFPQAVSSLVRHYGDANSMLEWINYVMAIDSFPQQLTPNFQLAARNVSLILGGTKTS